MLEYRLAGALLAEVSHIAHPGVTFTSPWSRCEVLQHVVARRRVSTGVEILTKFAEVIFIMLLYFQKIDILRESMIARSYIQLAPEHFSSKPRPVLEMPIRGLEALLCRQVWAAGGS